MHFMIDGERRNLGEDQLWTIVRVVYCNNVSDPHTASSDLEATSRAVGHREQVEYYAHTSLWSYSHCRPWLVVP